MSTPTSAAAKHEIAFEAFGVCMSVSASAPALLDRVQAHLPPGWCERSSAGAERRFSLTAEPAGTYALGRDTDVLASAQGLELDLALELLDSEIRLYLGRKAPDAIFIHAGVVAHHGRAIVMPAPSFGGKTTLVVALIRAGALYYSDEFAVLDENGLVRPYPKPLSIRGIVPGQLDHSVESLGGVAGVDALPIGEILVTSYEPGADWTPRRLSVGAGAMALFANAVPAQERPEQVMRVISRAVIGARILEGDRGEADQVAAMVLAMLDD